MRASLVVHRMLSRRFLRNVLLRYLQREGELQLGVEQSAGRNIDLVGAEGALGTLQEENSTLR